MRQKLDEVWVGAQGYYFRHEGSHTQDVGNVTAQIFPRILQLRCLSSLKQIDHCESYPSEVGPLLD